MPAIYIQSILGSRNDYDGVREAGHNRAINRQKYPLSVIEDALVNSSGLRHQVYTQLSKLIQQRRRLSAFHPDNPVLIFQSDNALLMMKRYHPDSGEGLLCVFNLSGRQVKAQLPEAHLFQDVIRGEKIDGTQPVTLDAWQFMWLR